MISNSGSYDGGVEGGIVDLVVAREAVELGAVDVDCHVVGGGFIGVGRGVEEAMKGIAGEAGVEAWGGTAAREARGVVVVYVDGRAGDGADAEGRG